MQKNSDLEDKVMESTQAEQKERIERHDNSSRELWENIKY